MESQLSREAGRLPLYIIMDFEEQNRNWGGSTGANVLLESPAQEASLLLLWSWSLAMSDGWHLNTRLRARQRCASRDTAHLCFLWPRLGLLSPVSTDSKGMSPFSWFLFFKDLTCAHSPYVAWMDFCCLHSIVRIRIVLDSVQFSHSLVSNSLWPHELQHPRTPCPSPTPGAYSNSCPSSRWCHPTISSFVIPFSFCLQCLGLYTPKRQALCEG